MDEIRLNLFQDGIKRQIILQNIDPNDCIISRFNTRKTRMQSSIQELADRIAQNGFELTRALWAYYNEDRQLEIFAGGIRLEAAKVADSKVVVVLHKGYTKEEISRLSDQDNEDDEYHERVSPVDVWAEYARLHDKVNGEGWTQQKIAGVKGVSQVMVSYRLRLHNLPEHFKGFINQKLLTETHLIEITNLSIDLYFSPWLTTGQIWEELVDVVLHGIRKDGKKSTRATAKDVKGWKGFIAEAERIYNKLEPITLYAFPEEGEPEPFRHDAPVTFVQELASREARSKNKVKEAARAIRVYINENLAMYKEYINAKSAKAAREAIKAEKERQLLAKFVHGNCLELLSNWRGDPIRLLLTDPPYGKEYQSNRRWRTNTPDKILGDGKNEAMGLLKDSIEAVLPHLADDTHVLVFCDWRREPEVREILEDAGLKLTGSLIWMKEGHSAGDVHGAFGPSHERIVHFTKGSPQVTPRIRDVLEVSRSRETSHPNEKPIALLEKLIASTTNEGDLVVDLFAGCASTLVAAKRSDREFWGAEIDANYHDEGITRLLKELDDAETGI